MVRPPYEAAVRLHAIAIAYWAAIDGAAAQNGVEPMTLRPDRFCNYVYAWAAERVENREEFDRDLLLPLPGRARKVSAELEQQEANDFMNFMGTMTGTG